MYGIVKLYEKIASKITLLEKIYIKLCSKMIKNEILGTEITPADKILHIGCGSIPYTALLITNATKTPVTAIDNDPDAIRNAKILIKKTGKNYPLVTLQCADGNDIAVSDFDVIFVSNSVKPKKIILERIISSMKEGARLVYRNPIKIFGLSYDYETVIVKGGKSMKHIKHSFLVLRESIIFEK
ncbi:MAG: hypothetical protein COT67_01170 [Candidatus Tagabacteria bacterium CG09_land_8_20_14_0_10_41_14]|uniref:Methyltransferase domain-containing protein n=2 Tax=Candidatus Tagaibacteriota TaxID=1817918 RepID=A0A2H0WLK9_9BACT|nr:MAG: hypothetical protein COT67_01170 [Candidatus Tagabacteria bacterium CG09_land_8_20_14_0_10_41_14]PJE73194.1 MAG: hypothetical protein COV00_01160 [Candidatus Tagabacteria bacterium CG10_big_fil_rev_8_21_14_0_10_40_13]